MAIKKEGWKLYKGVVESEEKPSEPITQTETKDLEELKLVLVCNKKAPLDTFYIGRECVECVYAEGSEKTRAIVCELREDSGLDAEILGCIPAHFQCPLRNPNLLACIREAGMSAIGIVEVGYPPTNNSVKWAVYFSDRDHCIHEALSLIGHVENILPGYRFYALDMLTEEIV